MTPRPPTVAEARTFDRLARDPAFLRVWANSVQDRPWWWGATEPRRVRIVRIAMQWDSTDADPQPAEPLTWRQEAAALCALALVAFAMACGFVAAFVWATDRLREATGGWR